MTKEELFLKLINNDYDPKLFDVVVSEFMALPSRDGTFVLFALATEEVGGRERSKVWMRELGKDHDLYMYILKNRLNIPDADIKAETAKLLELAK
jgi:hypothetical protein